jgi:SAM-dependent methyltransferase
MNLILDYMKTHYANPLVKNLDLNSPEAISVHGRIIRENQLLLRYHMSIYRYFQKKDEELKSLGLPSLEIGSGGGFLKKFLPDVITSDVLPGDGIDRVENACCLNFPDHSLKAVYANAVLHHISDSVRCLSEIQRVLVPGGVFVCNESSSTALGYFMNRNFHHEPTDKNVFEWGFAAQEAGIGRLTGANMALPSIIFRRDARLFHQRFPTLKIESIRYHDFLRYSLSGGLSYRPLVPSCLFWAVDTVEFIFAPLMFLLGDAMLVTVKKLRIKNEE